MAVRKKAERKGGCATCETRWIIDCLAESDAGYLLTAFLTGLYESYDGLEPVKTGIPEREYLPLPTANDFVVDATIRFTVWEWSAMIAYMKKHRRWHAEALEAAENVLEQAKVSADKEGMSV